MPSSGSVNNSLNTGHRRCRASQYGTPSFHRLCSEYGANTVPSLMVIFPVFHCQWAHTGALESPESHYHLLGVTSFQALARL